MRTQFLAAALALASTTALAQQPTLTLSYGEIQSLSDGLQSLDASFAQCGSKPPNVPCPAVSTTLTLVRDALALKGPLEAFEAARAKLQKETLNDPKLKGDCADPNPVGVAADKLSPECKVAQAKQVAAYGPKIQELIDTKVPLYATQSLTVAELNLAQNHVSIETLKHLAPLIPELAPKAK
jgi:hypothetical protein